MKIVTHSGVFHADDSFAVAIVAMMATSSSTPYEIVRTRNPDDFAHAVVVIDVGGLHDPGSCRYDHHQRGGAGERPNGIPFASAGLVWKDQGRFWIRGEYPALNEIEVETVHARLDRNLFAAIDAADNGYETATYRGDVRPLAVSGLVAMMNPNWDEPQTASDFDRLFADAVTFSARLVRGMAHDAVSWVKAASLVDAAIPRLPSMARAIEMTMPMRPVPRVMVLRTTVPWQEHLLANPAGDNVLYVIFQGTGDPNWMIQTVPSELGSFTPRKPLPEAWAGLRGSELQSVTDCPTAVFCHGGRFIAGADVLQDAMRMAQMAVDAA